MDQFNRQECLDVLAANLRLAAETIPTKVLVEAVNTRDRPGYLITTTAEAVDVIDRAGHDNLAIEYDLYHMQIMEGDLVATIAANLDRIGHIQFADTTNRWEPGTGEINYAYVFDAIDNLGWQGWLAAEYTPSKRTEETLGWLEPYL